MFTARELGAESGGQRVGGRYVFGCLKSFKKEVRHKPWEFCPCWMLQDEETVTGQNY